MKKIVFIAAIFLLLVLAGCAQKTKTYDKQARPPADAEKAPEPAAAEASYTTTSEIDDALEELEKEEELEVYEDDLEDLESFDFE